MMRSRLHLSCAFFVCVLVAAAAPLRAQDIEPRAFSNAPVGVNFLIAGYATTRGSLPNNLPLTDSHLHTDNAVVAYARVFELWGQSAKIATVLPYTWLGGTAMHNGQSLTREITGFGDPLMKLSVNLYGAPAMALKEFASYRQDLIIGASLQVTMPWSQYDPTRIVNIGSNRWSFKPEFGLSQAAGPWTFELAGSATFYTDNNDFYNGNTREQSALYGVQGHVIREFAGGVWGSVDATWFTGGRTTVNGVLNADLQRNWRIGGTLALPLDRNNSIKFYASNGVSARTGNNYNLIGIAWQYRWGAGL